MSAPERPRAATRLQQWLDANSFTSAQLEDATGIARQTMTRIRGGRAGFGITLRTMLRILRGCSVLAERKVRMDEIFDLDPESPQNLAA